MQVTVMLKNGRTFKFYSADLQKKNDGRSIVVFDTNTFRIMAEYSIDQVSAFQSSVEHIKNSRSAGV